MTQTNFSPAAPIMPQEILITFTRDLVVGYPATGLMISRFTKEVRLFRVVDEVIVQGQVVPLYHFQSITEFLCLSVQQSLTYNALKTYAGAFWFSIKRNLC